MFEQILRRVCNAGSASRPAAASNRRYVRWLTSAPASTSVFGALHAVFARGVHQRRQTAAVFLGGTAEECNEIVLTVGLSRGTFPGASPWLARRCHFWTGRGRSTSRRRWTLRARCALGKRRSAIVARPAFAENAKARMQALLYRIRQVVPGVPAIYCRSARRQLRRAQSAASRRPDATARWPT